MGVDGSHDGICFFPLKYVVPSPVEIEVGSVGDSKRGGSYVLVISSEEVKLVRHGGGVGGLLEI